MMSDDIELLPGNETPAEPLSGREVDLALRALRGWSRQDGGLRRRFRTGGFSEAVELVNRIAQVAGETGHYPDIDIRFRNVIVFLTTYEAGGITSLDIDLAARISEELDS